MPAIEQVCLVVADCLLCDIIDETKRETAKREKSDQRTKREKVGNLHSIQLSERGEKVAKFRFGLNSLTVLLELDLNQFN